MRNRALIPIVETLREYECNKSGGELLYCFNEYLCPVFAKIESNKILKQMQEYKKKTRFLRGNFLGLIERKPRPL